MTDLEKCRFLKDARGWTFNLDHSRFPEDFCTAYLQSPAGEGHALVFFDGMVENTDLELVLSRALSYH